MTDSVAVFPPGFRVLDTNGAPVNNAKIKFREVGPGATKNVFSDASLSTSLGHTIRTRSDGFPVVPDTNTTTLIYVGSAPYYVEITDENDVAIFPAKDNVRGAVDTSDFVTTDSTSVLVQPVVSISSGQALNAGSKGKLYDCNANGGFFTVELPDPAVVGDGWNVGIRNGGASNAVGILASVGTIATPMGAMAAVSLRLGEQVWLSCDGAGFKVSGYTPPLISGHTGVIIITDRVSSAPVTPVAGQRFIVTAPFSTFEAEDIIEATGQGTFFEITPPADCGWIAYVADEDINYQFRTSGWIELVPAATTSVVGAVRLADQTAMEAKTTGRVVTADVQHHHPTHPKFWAVVTVAAGTPTLAASSNVTSITDTATGRLTLTIDTDFSGAQWACHVSMEAASTTEARPAAVSNGTQAAGSVELCCRSLADNPLDPAKWHISGLGDHA